jgi:transcription elongation GreA/GreB family factor
VARALIGREAGETVQVQTPRGRKEYEITAVKFVSLD